MAENIWNLMAAQKLECRSPEENLKTETECPILIWIEDRSVVQNLLNGQDVQKTFQKTREFGFFTLQAGLDSWKNWLEKNILTSC